MKFDYFRSSEHVGAFAGPFWATDSPPKRRAGRAGLEKEEEIKQSFQLQEEKNEGGGVINQGRVYGSCVSYGFLKGSRLFRVFGCYLLINLSNFLVGMVFVP